MKNLREQVSIEESPELLHAVKWGAVISRNYRKHAQRKFDVVGTALMQQVKLNSIIIDEIILRGLITRNRAGSTNHEKNESSVLHFSVASIHFYPYIV
jgi:hypothetical protein